MGRLIIFDTSNFRDYPVGGQITSVKNFMKYIGEYYQEDEIINNVETDSESPDTNKTVKRIYTYALY